MQTEIINAIALSRLPYLNQAVLHDLYMRAGSATVVMENRLNIRDILPDATPKLVDVLADVSEQVHRAEAEYQWDVDNKIEALTLNDPHYPQRLKDCSDAPLVLFYRGSCDLNMRRVVSVIGTRHISPYGKDIIEHFMSDLKRMCPEVLVVSGLAYGVDINAHRQALKNGLPTVGVVAHGLDQIYPRMHRDTAVEMLSNGGLLTEFLSQTIIDKRNFVQRNRIVAGMADASILVESAAKGGGLITMRIASDYGRDVFAFPGPVNAEYSRGCNNLIRDNGAQLITSAEDFVNAMGWADDAQLAKARGEGIERSMFVDLNEAEQKIVDALRQANDLHTDVLCVKTGLPMGQLSSAVFTLEMKGVIRLHAGGVYHLI